MVCVVQDQECLDLCGLLYFGGAAIDNFDFETEENTEVAATNT